MAAKNITIKTATLADLDAIMAVEKSFSVDPQYHASREKMQSRIEKFPQGFFLTYVEDKLAYIISTCCVAYNPHDLSNFTSWDHITDNGFLSLPQPPAAANALYIVSGVVEQSFQQHNLFAAPYPHLLALTRQLQLNYIIAGAILPGYANYLEYNGPISAAEYAQKCSGLRLVDPLLEKYRRIHFHVPDQQHILADYYEHPGSCSYSALVVHDIAKDAPRNLRNDKN
jgi:hypothetical protein